MYAEQTKTYLYIEMGTDNPEWNYKTVYEGIPLYFSRPSLWDMPHSPLKLMAGCSAHLKKLNYSKLLVLLYKNLTGYSRHLGGSAAQFAAKSIKKW